MQESNTFYVRHVEEYQVTFTRNCNTGEKNHLSCCLSKNSLTFNQSFVKKIVYLRCYFIAQHIISLILLCNSILDFVLNHSGNLPADGIYSRRCKIHLNLFSIAIRKIVYKIIDTSGKKQICNLFAKYARVNEHDYMYLCNLIY